MHLVLVCGCFVRVPEVEEGIDEISFCGAAMGTEKGSMAVADAIKDVELEKIRGPGESKTVKLGSFWEDQVFALTCNVVRRLLCARGLSIVGARLAEAENAWPGWIPG
jgi:hypothetical protein